MGLQRGQKCVHQPMAVGMWQLLFSNSQKWELLDDWTEFLEKHHNRAISKDTWIQLLDFKKVRLSLEIVSGHFEPALCIMIQHFGSGL